MPRPMLALPPVTMTVRPSSPVSLRRRRLYCAAMVDVLGSPALRFEREGSIAWCVIEKTPEMSACDATTVAAVARPRAMNSA